MSTQKRYENIDLVRQIANENFTILKLLGIVITVEE